MGFAVPSAGGAEGNPEKQELDFESRIVALHVWAWPVPSLD